MSDDNQALPDPRPSSVIREHIERVQHEKAVIRASIDKAKRTAAQSGEYSDRAWLISAERAERLKGFAIGSLQVELGRAVKAEKQRAASVDKETFERAFMRQARALLPEGLYTQIIRNAAAAMAEESEPKHD